MRAKAFHSLSAIARHSFVLIDIALRFSIRGRDMICRLLWERDAWHTSRYRKRASRKCRARPRDCEEVHANLLSISCRQLRVNVNRARCPIARSLAHRGPRMQLHIRYLRWVMNSQMCVMIVDAPTLPIVRDSNGRFNALSNRYRCINAFS